MTLSDRAMTFGEVAEDYHRWRPSYPPAAVDWLAPAAPARVADVGAGSGKLTELLLARGLEVESVEPDERMLAVLGANNPAARLHHSSSTRIPVEDHALDAVLVADAWHWFDPDPTLAELRRVLKPGGWLGIVWNVAAEPVEPWERDLAADSDDYDRKSKASTDGLNKRLSYFDPDELESNQVEWVWEVSPHHLASLQATTSMAIAMTADERAASFEESQALLQQICDAHGTRTMPLRQVATCIRWSPKA
ncbi:class I SAM-dependent methyltransferase [Nocardioides sp.]|uniref:class I SAM-dependent methyltransferase n=1 Tax=Nocardioides sp. TaxID=35761 RepID=UPI002C130052|nr:methyltransferase domain-containing protein [Nocardioides sp.]HXH76863.1 methyltransferase domain-containing protein [Nocardioides sp.]